MAPHPLIKPDYALAGLQDLKGLLFNFQWTEDGPTGLTGAHARERVEMESSTASDAATIPHPSTEARNVKEHTSKPEHAT